MNPALKQAAESLAADLATTNKSISELERTEPQKMLNIAPHLVYLCGLACAAAAATATAAVDSNSQQLDENHPQQREFFQHLQDVYYSTRNRLGEDYSDTKTTTAAAAAAMIGPRQYYRWSPSLLPSQDAAEKIRADLQQRQQQLANQADRAARELLKLELEEEQQLKVNEKIYDEAKKSDGAVKKKKKKNRATACVSRGRPETEQPQPRETCRQSFPVQETLEELMFASAVRTVEDDDVDDDESMKSSNVGGWIQVTKNCKQSSIVKTTTIEDNNNNNNNRQNAAYSASPLREEQETPLKSEMSQLEEVPEQKDAPETIPQQVQNSEKKQSCSNQNEAKHSAALSNDHHHDDDDNNNNNNSSNSVNVSLLQSHIQQLESELVTQRQLLKQERLACQRTLQQTVESYEERMRGLQLRLHISETRLQTYEDALARHVEAVTNNTAPTTPRTHNDDNNDDDDNDDNKTMSRILRIKHKKSH